jgi:hypothetical protein
MKDIKETKELLRAILSFGSASGKAWEDKKFDWSEVTLFIQPLTMLPAALQGVSEIPAEWKDMDAAERDELMKVCDEFDIPQENVEEIVEKALKAAVLLGKKWTTQTL